MCMGVTTYWHPRVRHRGDFTKDSVSDVAELIRSIDPDNDAMLLITAGPPCPDFSRIRSRSAPGHRGTEGQKFGQFCEFTDQLEYELSRQAHKVVENVVMEPKDADLCSEMLSYTPVMIDACDFSIIRRPRLWWTTIKWDDVQQLRSPITDTATLSASLRQRRDPRHIID